MGKHTTTFQPVNGICGSDSEKIAFANSDSLVTFF